MSRERDDDGPWCESCRRVMLDTEDPEDWFDGVCPECDRDEAPTNEYPSHRARTHHCREMALDDLIRDLAAAGEKDEPEL